MLPWIGLALLSGSWLFGLGYFHPADEVVWSGLIFLGTALLAALQGPRWGPKESLLALILLAPSIVVAPPPYVAAPLLIAAGLTLNLMPALRPWASRLIVGPAVLGWPMLTAILVLAGYLLPAPFRVVPLLALFGLIIDLPPQLRRFSPRASTATIVAGSVLLIQAVALLAYESFTADSHDLPQFLTHVLATVFGLLGIDVAENGATLAVRSMRQTSELASCWELLFDPGSCAFFTGGIALIGWLAWAYLPTGRRMRFLTRALIAIVCVMGVWLPVRAGVYVALYLHNVLRLDYDAPLDCVKLLWSHWVHLLFLLPPAVVLWRFVPRTSGIPSAPTAPGPAAVPSVGQRTHKMGREPKRETRLATSSMAKWQRPASAVLVAIAAALATLALVWDPIGDPQQGRVVIEESSPKGKEVWERTDKPYDTTWYGHLAGYNYYCIYDYCSRFFDVTRLTDPISGTSLENADVLVIKVPTREYSDEEVAAVTRFVDRGGGLLLVGEHTNVFGSGVYLNKISRNFGFSFRYDCLFGVDSVFKELYQPSFVPHPIVQHIDQMDFATSCSIDPGRSRGRAVIRGLGLKSLPADYHADNFYPVPEDRPDMRYGAFVQLYALRYGKGRVVAFTDSTIFSNFCTFEPGKAELMLGMLNWLNHRSGFNASRWFFALLAAAVAALFAALWLARSWDSGWLMLLATAIFAWSVVAWAVPALSRRAMPAPQPRSEMVQVAIDRNLSEVGLPTSGFIGGKPNEFGIFERWILRLGYFTSRRSGLDLFDSDLAVILVPTRLVTSEFRDRAVRYVEEGGKLLVIDTAENIRSTANDLLEPFGIMVDRGPKLSGNLRMAAGWPTVPVEEAAVVKDLRPPKSDEETQEDRIRPFAFVNDKPVGAVVRRGRGSVTIIGFGTRFSDPNLGVTGDVTPDDQLMQLYELDFALLRAIVAGGDFDRPLKVDEKSSLSPQEKAE